MRTCNGMTMDGQDIAGSDNFFPDAYIALAESHERRSVNQ